MGFSLREIDAESKFCREFSIGCNRAGGVNATR